MAGTIPFVGEYKSGFTSRWLKCAMDPNFATTTVVRFKSSSRLFEDPLRSRIGFGCQGSQFIQANGAGSLWFHRVSRYDEPLFPTNSGSCFSGSWNQLSCLRQQNPSSSTQVQMVESDRWTPWRSLKALCNRSRVHNSKGYPKLLGFCRARSSSALRISWPWVGGRHERSPSNNPDKPASLKRLTQWMPRGAPLKPAGSPALEGGILGSSNIAAITRARCTNLSGSFREFASRLISTSSSVVNVRKFIRFGISSSCLSRGLF